MNLGVLELSLLFLVVVVLPVGLVVARALTIARARVRMARYRQFYEALWDATGGDDEDGPSPLRQAACLLQLLEFPEFLERLGPIVAKLEASPNRDETYRQAVQALRRALPQSRSVSPGT